MELFTTFLASNQSLQHNPYTYDGDGRRVRKATYNGEVTVFVYDAAGRVVAEYSNRVEAKGTRYLTHDQLGSTRVVTDAQGNAHSENGAGGSRHDYLPFGEEVGVGVGGRVTTQGYSAVNVVRQKFAKYERDSETGLDYVRARYYSSTNGRFTSPDPLLASGRIANAQSWNRYAYVLGNPLRYSDPLGLFEFASGTSQADMNRIKKAYDDLVKARGKYEASSKQYKAIDRSLQALGAPGVANGVTVAVNNGLKTPGIAIGGPDLGAGGKYTGTANVVVELNLSKFSNDDAWKASLAGALGHEGSHTADHQSEAAKVKGFDITEFDQAKTNGQIMSHAITEVRAYRVSAYIAEAISPSNSFSVNGHEIWNRGWSSADASLKREIGIKGVLESPQGSYRYSFSGTPSTPLGTPFLFTERTLDNPARWTSNGGSIF